jgi:hypothetical protein
MFVRGKNGIARLERMAQQGTPVSVKEQSVAHDRPLGEVNSCNPPDSPVSNSLHSLHAPV